MRISRPIALIALALLAAACAPAAPVPSPTQAPSKPAAAAPAASPAAKAPSPSEFEKIVEAAKREGKVVLWTRTFDNTTRPQIEKAFNDRFKTNITFELVPITGSDAVSRMIAEASGGRHDVDALLSLGTAQVLNLKERELLANINWKDIFGQPLPDIKSAAEIPYVELNGLMLNFWDSAYIFYYNTRFAKPDDLPKRYAELADAKYRGKLTVGSGAFPFYFLFVHQDWGVEKTLKLVRDLAANDPLLKRGSADILQAVVSGEALMGVGSIQDPLEQKSKGVPIELIVPDYVPHDGRYNVIAAKAPNPNAARLFAAWSVSEGMEIFGKLFSTHRLSQPNNPIEQIIKQQNPNAKLAATRTIQELELSDKVRKEASDILAKLN